MTDIKLAIGIPCGNSINVQTVSSLVEIIGNSPWPTHTIFMRGCYVHENREKIVLQAQEVKATHLFFLDSDMKLENGTVSKLLAHDKDIVGVNYHQRILPLVSTVKFADENEKIIEGQVGKELLECFAVATGCMLINMRVFDIIDKPWFFFGYDSDGKMMGEDVWFCRQAKRKGLGVWCDPNIKIGHIGEYEY